MILLEAMHLFLFTEMMELVLKVIIHHDFDRVCLNAMCRCFTS
jgi:hypothetical protein